MVINFVKPLFLLLLPLAFLLIWHSGRRMKGMQLLRKRLIYILRALVVTLLVLSLSGMNIKWMLDTVSTIFVVDASDSFATNKGLAEAFVREAMQLKPGKDNAGVVAFGDNTLVESFIERKPVFEGLHTKPSGLYTNIENALTTALSLFPESSRKRVVLITDGKENTGDSSKLASYMLEQGVDLKLFRLDTEASNEAAVDSIEVPQKVSLGEEFSIVVNITSRISTSAKLTLISGRNSTVEEQIQLQKGSNRFAFRDRAESGGLKSYRVVLEPVLDTESRNNEASAIISVLDRPRILVIEDKAGEADDLIGILEASDIDFKRIFASAAPSTLQELAAYKTIISCNVSAENLNEGFLNSLETYVRDMGGGFIAAGGEDSFALGGYYKTSLEKVLPVSMELKGKKEVPDMAMVLIIDKSGSMTEGRGGITRLDIAKEAAARTLDSLRPKDQIGVIAFDDTVYWVVKTQTAEAGESIRDDIGTIRPGGGTSILPALEEGYESISKVNAKIRHIILLTDGQAEQTGYDVLIKKMNEENITISTVAVGQGADVRLLETIAKGGNGRFYFTDEFLNIPRIFAKETFMAARAYLNNREFVPGISSLHPILMGVGEQGLPSLLGYVAATPKDTARVLLTSDQEDPILTVWQYGLGKTAAWTSDVSGKWNANYAGWEKNAVLWQNIVNWTIEKYEQGMLHLEAKVQGSKGIIKVMTEASAEASDLQATVISPSLESINLVLQPTAPGEYVGSFDIRETGGYLIKAVQRFEGETITSAETGLSVQYSPEYKLDANAASIERLLKEAGGTIITTAEEVYKGELKDVFGIIDLTNFLLTTALLLFLLDTAIRRLNLPLGRLEAFLGAIKFKAANKRKPPVMKTIAAPEKAKKETTPTKKEQPHNKSEDKVSLDTSALLKKKKPRA